MLRKFIFISFLCFLVGQCFAATIDDIKTAVNNFCQTEFDGNETMRYNIVTFSQTEFKKEQEEKFPVVPGILEISSDPVIIVKNFSIEKITLNSKETRASAKIKYQRIGELKGEGDSYSSGYGRWLIVSPGFFSAVLNLVKIKNQWKILNPPIAKVSLDSLLDYYKWSTALDQSIDHDELSYKKQPLNLIINQYKNLKLYKELQCVKSNPSPRTCVRIIS